jgi:ferritin-like metal-binding protein YciE
VHGVPRGYLTKTLKDHLEETKNQIQRLDQVFKKLGKQPQGIQCPAIDGLIEDGDEIADEVADKDVLDAAIIGAAQAVELRDRPLWHADRLGGVARRR